MFDAMKGVCKGAEYVEAKWCADPSVFVEYRNGENEDVLFADDGPDWLSVGAQNAALAVQQKAESVELVSLHQPQPMDEVFAEEIWRDMLVPGQDCLELYT